MAETTTISTMDTVITAHGATLARATAAGMAGAGMSAPASGRMAATTTPAPIPTSTTTATSNVADCKTTGPGCRWAFQVTDGFDRPSLADHQQVVGGQGHLAHQVAGDQHGAALGGERPHQGPDPVDAVGVEAVHRFVEDEHGRVPEERRGDAEPLTHAQREALRPAPGHALETDGAEHLVYPAAGDAVTPGQAQQVVAGPAATVQRLGVEEGAHLTHGRRQVTVAAAADGYRALRRRVKAQDHPHGGGLPGAVRAEEAGDHAGPDGEREVVDG